MFCAAFRRLQQKAQVFSMEPNAAVRSRLTHSLEVSQIGRYIADLISLELEAKQLASSEECRALVNFVETACLMHDIGNPPFGHFGEAAIRRWFEDNGVSKATCAIQHGLQNNVEIAPTDQRLIRALADFKEFDGNPQGLRVVTRLQWNTDHNGLNLTHTTLAAYLKYLRCSGIAAETVNSKRFHKKSGYFSTEEDIVKKIWAEFNYDLSNPQRFPLTYILEAADDIAYCISDLEDSIEKGLVDKREALSTVEATWLKEIRPTSEIDKQIASALRMAVEGKNIDGQEYSYTDFRTALNRAISKFAADTYIENHEMVFSGQQDSLLSPASGAGAILEILKRFCKENVYCHESVERIELAGYAAIYGLLDHYGCLLKCSSSDFRNAIGPPQDHSPVNKQMIIEKKLLNLFPPKYKKVYLHLVSQIDASAEDKAPFEEWSIRAHLVVDFLAGMTDDFAMSTFQTLSGMRL